MLFPHLKKFAYALLCLVMLSVVSSADARDMETIKASGKLIVAVPNIRNPPFFFEEKGQLIGLDIDMAKSIAETMGLQIVFNRDAKSFNEAVTLVANGQADIATAKISRTLERAQSVLFSEPYITLPHALLVNRLRYAEISQGRPLAEVMQQYNGTIGVIAKSAFVGFAKTYFPKAKIIEFDTWETLVDAVSKGTVATAYRDAFEVKRVFKINPNLTLTVRSVLIEDIKDTIGIVVGPKNFLLQNFLNLFLEQKNFKFTSDQILA
ncbi:MAG: substrate-binding periplasmic protein, partial [Burkholderiaceae bacterium]